MRKRFSIAYQETGEALTAERRFAYTASSGFSEVTFSFEEGTIRPDALSKRQS